MLKSYLVAILAISGLMVAWAFVQRTWGRVFTPTSPETDVLEQRRSCGSCGCARPCSTSTGEPDEKGRVSIDNNAIR